MHPRRDLAHLSISQAPVCLCISFVPATLQKHASARHIAPRDSSHALISKSRSSHYSNAWLDATCYNHKDARRKSITSRLLFSSLQEHRDFKPSKTNIRSSFDKWKYIFHSHYAKANEQAPRAMTTIQPFQPLASYDDVCLASKQASAVARQTWLHQVRWYRKQCSTWTVLDKKNLAENRTSSLAPFNTKVLHNKNLLKPQLRANLTKIIHKPTNKCHNQQ